MYLEVFVIEHSEYDPIWDGPDSAYEDHMWDQIAATGRLIKPWDQLENLCGEPRCVLVAHTRVRTPTRLEYPAQVCTYCGTRSGTRDHLVTRVWTGDADRKWVLTVPACAECNSIIGSNACKSIDGRRRVAQNRLRKKYRKHLLFQDLSEEELAEYGPGLQPIMREAAELRRLAEYRLRWPIDPTYDLRYLAKSGITDPFANGLLEVNPILTRAA